jgi:DNA polymerase-1
MIEADRVVHQRGWDGKVNLVLQVHDELVYEIEKGIVEEVVPLLRAAMEGVAPQAELNGVPIIAEAKQGSDWDAMAPSSV